MLQFTCDHCETVKEYTQQTLSQVQRDTVSIKDFVVCKECAEEYKDITKKVQEFADAKRKELEAEFFNEVKESKPSGDEDTLQDE